MRFSLILLILLNFLMIGCRNTSRNFIWEHSSVLKKKDLKIGDVIILEKEIGFFSSFGHSGLVVEDLKVLEIPKLGEKVMLSPLEYWIYKDRYVVVLRPKKINNLFRKRLSDESLKHLDKNYSLKVLKKRFNNFYCSQLIWYIYYKTSLDFNKKSDIDSNRGIFVYPYDILNSKYFYQFF